MSLKDYYTRDKANAGKRIPLPRPDGSAGDDWLHVLSVDSDAFRAASLESERRLAGYLSDHPQAEGKLIPADVVQRERVKRLSALVTAWSFNEVCTPEAVEELLTQAPQIAALLDLKAAQRGLFYGVPSSN